MNENPCTVYCDDDGCNHYQYDPFTGKGKCVNKLPIHIVDGLCIDMNHDEEIAQGSETACG
jgi:hypothetical protein